MGHKLLDILSMSSWSFILVITTVVFGYVGLRVDKLIGSEPTFLTGFIFLAVTLCLLRFYKEIKSRMSNFK